jgi:uncharacterized protein (UPF0262 family)
VPLVDVHIESPPECASEARRAEWRVATAELRRYAVFVFPGVADPWVLRVRRTPLDLAIAAVREQDGTVLVESVVPDAHLMPAVGAYVDSVRHLQEAGPGAEASPERIAALDARKRAAHDAGARMLARLLPGFGADHETLRRLFSLLLAVRVDTTRLVDVFGHRRMR